MRMFFKSWLDNPKYKTCGKRQLDVKYALKNLLRSLEIESGRLNEMENVGTLSVS